MVAQMATARSSSRSPTRSGDHAGRGAAVASDAIIATGRSDYPNQVNNVLGFPFIFRGALDVRATEINEEMKMAATRALARSRRRTSPTRSRRCTAAQRALRAGLLIPFPFDPRVLLSVAPAVAWAAVASGVAHEFIDLEGYRERLEARLGRARGIMRGLINRAMRDPKRIVFPEGEEPKIIRAASTLVEDGIAFPILLGNPETIKRIACENRISLDNITIDDPATSPRRDAYAHYMWQLRQRKGLSLDEARRSCSTATTSVRAWWPAATRTRCCPVSRCTTPKRSARRSRSSAPTRVRSSSAACTCSSRNGMSSSAPTPRSTSIPREQLAQIGFAASRVARTMGHHAAGRHALLLQLRVCALPGGREDGRGRAQSSASASRRSSSTARCRPTRRSRPRSSRATIRSIS
jgi:malate dehydrogenase (oxaloacetate-decarboxylating)(NADP+)